MELTDVICCDMKGIAEFQPRIDPQPILREFTESIHPNHGHAENSEDEPPPGRRLCVSRMNGRQTQFQITVSNFNGFYVAGSAI
jgi:hypothetical protein